MQHFPEFRLALQQIAHKVPLVQTLHDEQHGRTVGIAARVERLGVPEIAAFPYRFGTGVTGLQGVVDDNAAAELAALLARAETGYGAAHAHAVDGTARGREELILPSLAGQHAHIGESGPVPVRADGGAYGHGLGNGELCGAGGVYPFAVRPCGQRPGHQIAGDEGLAVTRRHADGKIPLPVRQGRRDPARQRPEDAAVKGQHAARRMDGAAVRDEKFFQRRQKRRRHAR